MIENIAILAGVSAIVVSFMGIVAFLLLKKNIKDILQKDSLIFDQNFEIKKRVISESFSLIDEVEKNGKIIINNATFMERATNCYNELLCVVNNYKIIDEFYNIALNGAYAINKNITNNYKILCRKDIGLKTKKINNSNIQSQPVIANIPTPVQPEINYTPVQESVNAEPTESIPTQQKPTPTTVRPAQVRPTATRPTQARPSGVRPATRPTQSRVPSSEDQKK